MGTVQGPQPPLFTPGGRGYEEPEPATITVSSSLQGWRWWPTEEEKARHLLPPLDQPPGPARPPDRHAEQVARLGAAIARAERGVRR